MARPLDPKLQKIITDVSNGVHPSGFPHGRSYNGGSSGFSDRRLGQDFDFIGSHHPAEGFLTHQFDSGTVQTTNATRQSKPTGGILHLTAPSNPPCKDIIPLKLTGQSIYSHQISQQYATNEPALNNGFRTAGQINSARSDPSDFFHGLERNLSRQLDHEPKTPFNASRFVYSSPTQAMRTPPNAHANSSPTARISLRRETMMQFSPLSIGNSRRHSEEEVFPYTVAEQEKTKKFGMRSPTSPLSHGPPTVQGIKLVSPVDLPDRFRPIFPYELLNAVQSKCFNAVYKATDNVVIAAPTGSGKTAIMELAICKLVQDYGSSQFKVVYQAPTKSLCAERVRDWGEKFRHLNLNCAELTGDTDPSEMHKVGNAVIIVTTPEKWDSITRKWKDHIKLLQLVKLFLIDEVHILKDPRGATLEAVVSRMKSIGTNVRFVALSATVPNSDDIATWLGKDHINSHLPAYRETFGEEFRPVKLKKHVYGFRGTLNDHALDSTLNIKLPGLIAKHAVGKPMIIFCFTRKSCESTALKLAGWWESLRPSERPWPVPAKKVAVGNKDLSELVDCGVAFHHAGLDAQDRAVVESGFVEDGISVICCTSTLAVGVNLPCHLVVIKNTVCYTDGGLHEYSDLEMMQMLGRAGRPQFDTSAVAVIMTRTEKVERYTNMISGNDILESTLHLNLMEHLNSEIGLGTVHDVYSAKRWLAGTFLSVRMRLNPHYYRFNCDTDSTDVDERLERVCERDIGLLQTTKLITSDQRLTCTEYGLAMSKYMVQFDTMRLLLTIPPHAKVTQILHFISQAAEFKDLRMKQNERSWFRELNKSPFIKSPIKENITTYAHKVSLTIQAQLGGVELLNEKEFGIDRRQFAAEKVIIFDRIRRLVKCVVECKAFDCDGVATCNALELARSISADFWEHSTLQLRQIPNIGPAAVRKLVQSNVKTIVQLAAMDSASIERAMSRNPPFGQKILDSLSRFPQLTLKADITNRNLQQGQPIRVQMKANLGFSNFKVPRWRRNMPCLTFTVSISNGALAHIWRGPINRLEKGFDITFTCDLLEPDDEITCRLACEDVVGSIQTVVVKPGIPASAFSLHHAKPNQGSIGSDYGEDIEVEDFIDINQFDRTDEGQEIICVEPTQMANGRWLCNHKCSHGRGIKRSILCKHTCCKDGLGKPRKAMKKRAGDVKDESTYQGNTKAITEDSRKSKFKLAEEDLYFDDMEEVDLTDEVLVVDQPATQQTSDVSNIRYEKKTPLFSYANGTQPDTLQTCRLHQNHRMDTESQEDDEYSLDEEFQLHLQSLDFQSELPRKFTETLPVSESFENSAFDFSVSSDVRQPSSSKRSAPPMAEESELKRRLVEEDEAPIAESTKPVPEWVNEMDPGLVAFFGGWAEFV